MLNLSYKEKLSLVKDLLTLASVDHLESENEIEFVHQLGRKLGLEQSDIDGLVKKDIEFQPPVTEDLRISIFYTFILVVKVDGIVAHEEVQFCREVGLKLGLNQLAVNNLLKRVADYPEENLPPNEVIGFFKLHHN